ncbi:MAG: Gfo/Idh/MocA family oxidoreductase [Planctomycetia bacterium]|nr:Gfo/Idh/MocA family oxidoreductase [Planctomycetia bacterium]
MSNQFSRRSFLSNNLLGAGAAALSGSLLAQNNVQGFEQSEKENNSVWEPFSDKKVKVGLVGYGFCKFAAQWEFQNHPNVEIVAVSDLFEDRCNELAKVVKCEKTYPSLEEMVKDDSIEAIFCATDAPSHAKHCIEVLKHGKHVATAVPVFYGNIEYADMILECVKENPDLIYAMFETSTFHDDLYAMSKIYEAGGFGKILYSEGEYCHTKAPGSTYYPSYGDWRKNGCPIWYPTHATAYHISVTHGSFIDVSCKGFTYKKDKQPNASGNIFDGEVGLFRTNDGGMSRMMCHSTYGVYLEAGRVRGEIGGFDGTFQDIFSAYTGTDEGRRIVKELGDKIKKYPLPPTVQSGSHGGSHGYHCDNFIRSILLKEKPAVGIIDALNMTVPGYYAHLSAVKDGETMKIPQYSL